MDNFIKEKNLIKTEKEPSELLENEYAQMNKTENINGKKCLLERIDYIKNRERYWALWCNGEKIV